MGGRRVGYGTGEGHELILTTCLGSGTTEKGALQTDA